MRSLMWITLLFGAMLLALVVGPQVYYGLMMAGYFPETDGMVVSPTFDRVGSPDGKFVAILGHGKSSADPFDYYDAVWIALPDSEEKDWHPVEPWRERDMSARWNTPDKLVVWVCEDEPGESRSFRWHGVAVEVREVEPREFWGLR